ncbi:MAG: hypothetical protein ACXAC7_21250 [Candidatus Hodarchaeales archaeon]|jgi:hypothetical protein
MNKISEILIVKNKKVQGNTIYKYIKSYYENDRPATYTDKGRYQCGAGASRSFGDLYRIAKGKFPDATEKEVAKALYRLSNNFPTTFRSIYCPDVKKYVFTGRDCLSNYLLKEELDHMRNWELDRGVKHTKFDKTLREIKQLLND